MLSYRDIALVYVNVVNHPIRLCQLAGILNGRHKKQGFCTGNFFQHSDYTVLWLAIKGQHQRISFQEQQAQLSAVANT